MDMFEKQYPFIKVDLLRSGSGALVNRVVSEYAGEELRRRRFARYVHPGRLHRPQTEKYSRPLRITRAQISSPAELRDKNGYWGSTFQNTFVLAYNKRNVKPYDVPKTYEDLLKPMWKGRQIINDTDNFEWFDGLLKFWGREKGWPIFGVWRSRTKSFSAARGAASSWSQLAKRP